MRHPSLTRRGAIAVASLALASTAALGGLATAATAATQAEPASTPVTINTPDGQLMSYIVNARVANPGQTRLVEKAVTDAGGVVVQSWPQIGVVIAHSKVSTFRADVVAKGANAVDSVGATRTVAVSEGTVTLLGQVLCRDEHDAAVAAAWAHPSVRSVDDHLTVAPSDPDLTGVRGPEEPAL